MKQQKVTLAAFVCAVLFLVACSNEPEYSGYSEEDHEAIVGENDHEVAVIVDKTISGVSQKGPFVNGSSVTVRELDEESLAQTGYSYEGKIKNDKGEFSLKVAKLVSPYVLLKANGFYRNEITGEKSKSPVTLYALTDLSERDEANVNLLTHMAYERSIYLAVEESLSVANAKKQAETEVLKSFGIEGDFDRAEDWNLFGEGDQSAALMALSILMRGDLSEADFDERLANYASDIEVDGKWDDDKTATAIADWASALGRDDGFKKIRNNIAGWGISAAVPPFEKYVNFFWRQKYGLGVCDDDREGEILKNQNAMSSFADSYYICKSEAWREATDCERDTYGWDDGKDGDVRRGDVFEDNCYVYEDSVWRIGNANDCSLRLRGCTALRQDSVGEGADKVWYICDDRKWREAIEDETELGVCNVATEGVVGKAGSTYYICTSGEWVKASKLEYDTYQWPDGKEGDSKWGSVNTDICYVFENREWRYANKENCTLGLGGCTERCYNRDGNPECVRQASNGQWYTCFVDGGGFKGWIPADDYDVLMLGGMGTFDGEIRVVEMSGEKSYFIYDAMIEGLWVSANTFEKDTYDYENNRDWSDGEDGELRKGAVTDTMYVFDKYVWRAAVEVNKAECTEFGQIAHGKVNPENKYFCYGDHWRIFRGREDVSYGKLVDERDGKVYRTVKIGEQTWMAENLNYEDEIATPVLQGRSGYPLNRKENSVEYGRVYTWTALIDSIALATDADNPMDCGYGKTCSLTADVRGVCPNGWHLPTRAEWKTLVNTAGGDSQAGKVLMSQGQWMLSEEKLDLFGFSMLVIPDDNQSYWLCFWSATETSDERAYSLCFDDGSGVSHENYDKRQRSPVRCVKDEE